MKNKRKLRFSQEQHLRKAFPSCGSLVNPLTYPLFLQIVPCGILPVLIAVNRMTLSLSSNFSDYCEERTDNGQGVEC